MYTQNKLSSNWLLPPTWLRLLIIVVLLLGIFFRFANLDGKVYSGDETKTSLRISGYRGSELFQQVFNGREVGIEDLQKYQQANPERNLLNTIEALAIEDSQHPPLYYTMAHFWVRWFGSSMAATRSLSALISLLAFPCIYWLSLELFESSLVGWIAIAILAISPFHVLYAQDAREYSLWTVMILLASAALLRAMRLKTKLSWSIYAATVALGLYTHLLSGLVVIGHGVYVAIIEGCRWSRTVTAYLIASLLGLLAFMPWLVSMHTFAALKSTAKQVPMFDLVRTWAANPSRIFLDLNLDADEPLIYLVPPILVIWALIGYSIYFICRKTPKRIWLFIITMIGVTALALMLPDLIFGGRRSSISRFLIPCYLGIQLAVAYLLATQIISKNFLRKTWQVIMIVLISSGVLSCIVSSQADTWWNKKNSDTNPQVARIINQASHPLLVSGRDSYDNLLSLSYLLEPKVRLQVVVEPNIPKLSKDFSDVFLFNPTKTLQNRFEKEKNYKIEPVYQPGRLWHLEKR